MKKNYPIAIAALFFLFLLSGPTSLFSQSQLCLGVGGNDNDAGYSMVQTADSGYVIAGDTKSYGSGSSDVYVVKLDKTGAVVWTRTVGGAGNDFARSIVMTSDGSFVVAGYTNSYGAGGNDIYVVKLDAAGTVVWTRTVGGIRDDVGWTIIKTSDGGFAIAGQSTSFSTGINDMYLLKLDSSGTKKWDARVTRGNIACVGYSVAQAADGGYVLCGTTPGKIPSGMYSPDWYVVKLDSANRSMVWNRYIVAYPGKDYYTQPTTIINTSDGGFMVAGYASQPKGSGSYTHDMYTVKLDGAGAVSWTSFYGGSGTGSGNNDDQIKSVIQTSDGGYMLAGFSRSFGALYIGSQTIYVVKIDGTGSMLWNKVIGTKTADQANCIISTADGGYAMSGYTLYPSGTTQNVSLVKLDVNTLGACCEGVGGVQSFIAHSTGTIGSAASASGAVVLNSGTSGTGGTRTINTCGTSIPPPIASFQADDDTICSDDCVYFYDLSSYASSWLWDFPGGTPSSSTLANPTVCYFTPGDYDVNFWAFNSSGSDSVKNTTMIHVSASPITPTIIISNDTLYCSFDPSYTSYQWYDGPNLVSGATNSYYVFNHAGNYNVKVTSSNGCETAVGIVLGTQEVTVQGLQFTLYPNPASEELLVTGYSLAGKSVLSIFNILGEIVYSKELNYKQEMIDCKQFSPGVYVMRIEDEQGSHTTRFLKE